ncbi:GFA family protein [Microbulbifer halophilus]|uniref:GFA family protein n=1 Tax=Microbulbifer halophilus TaxID=453963 RepID=A0ABW5E6Q5_9GAMM|nr:GFA family protein [Microbulbifer halophilus]MCW8126086.1 GFA family protein [Microbulbifer halophilus]
MTTEICSGGCHCGAVRFAASGEPKIVERCHCGSCRRTTGGAFATWVGFDDEQVEWLSPPAFYRSSKGVRRGFCRDCGTPLSYQGGQWAGETYFLIGVFEEPREFEPRGDVFIEEALDWCLEGYRQQ